MDNRTDSQSTSRMGSGGGVLSLCRLVALLAAGWLVLPGSPVAAEYLSWNTNQNRVSADINGAPLFGVLEQVASATGWRVFVEPDTAREVSVKFDQLPPGDALRMLLGDINFALVPETNGTSRLFVFHSSRQSATQPVRPPKAAETNASKVIPNELIVRLKPGANIEDIARRLGAKVVGKIDGLNAYRLQFPDATATDEARQQLTSMSDVASVENNYFFDRPMVPTPAQGTAVAAPPQLQLKPPPDNGRLIIGLVDTAVQHLGNNLDQFLLKQISVAGEAQLDPSTPAHGTSMAETILSSLQAVTKGSTSVQILPVDVYGANTSSSTFDVASGITQAVNGGAKIINLSLGSNGDSPILGSIITDAVSKGIVIYAAAGNQPVTTPYYPAAYPGVNAVTAVDQGQVAPYANRGSFVSLGAPGTSTIYFNGQPYYVTGTSTSTAELSGTAAGYADANHTTAANGQAYTASRFAVKLVPAQ